MSREYGNIPRLISVFLVLLFSGFEGVHAQDAKKNTEDKAMFGEWGVETKNLSKTVSPGDDFYVYVNEGWLKSTEIPKGFPTMGSFVFVHIQTEDQLKTIINDLLAGKTKDVTGRSTLLTFRPPEAQSARDFVDTCGMDRCI